MARIILFSESILGFHSKTEEDCQMIPLVFIPEIKKDETGKYFAYINLSNNQKIKPIFNESIENIFFLLGYDLDENGEFMAHALKNFLISKGVNENQIIRTPLTEDGYIAISDFLNIEKFLEYKIIDKEFQSEIKKSLGFNMTINDVLSLVYLDRKKGKTLSLDGDGLNEKINLQGTSTITFVTNQLLGETDDLFN